MSCERSLDSSRDAAAGGAVLSAPAPTATNEREHATYWRGVVERTVVSHMKGVGWLAQLDQETQLTAALSRVSSDLQREISSRVELYTKRCVAAHADAPKAAQYIEQTMNGQLWVDLSALAVELRAKARST